VTAAQDAIAIVGMACRLPGAADARRYWATLRAGAEAISRFDRDRLVAEGADPQHVRHPDFVPARGVLAGAHNFDWQLFGYSRAEAAAIDPQQRVFLECATAAVDDTGLDPSRFSGRIGVYVGADKVTARAGTELSELARAIGEEKDFLASRVSYKLGLRGPAVTVQTACSTSLTTVHLAAQSLRCHDCDAALAGGVTVLPPDDRGYRYEHGGILSPDGHCRPFDEQAAGTVPSEGVGVVVLKRLTDALRDGDRIAAVILGSAINNDGGEKVGYTAPSIIGQSEAIRYALKAADVDPDDISYVEAHGTATQLGDPIEVQALTDVFGPSKRATGPCWLGAVKSNIGHTGAAAGVAGLIKTVLMLEYRELVPTLHYTKPNPLLDLDLTPFEVCVRAQPWPDRRGGGAPLAGVSSFGLGGSNAHVVLAGHPLRMRPTARSGPRLLGLSAASEDALNQLRHSMAGHLAAQPGPTLPGVARTLARRRRFGHRQAFVAADLTEAVHLMRGAPDTGAPSTLRRVAFLFPGQGTLRTAAGAAPYRLLAGFRAYFDEIRDAIKAAYGLDLSPVVTDVKVADGWFHDTVHQQLGLFALGCALARQLIDWGVKPAVMLGNSVGEYAAAALAGTWTIPDAARLVYQRAQAMWDTEPGLMAAVTAPATEVGRRIGPDSRVTVAVAAPGAVIISGSRQSMDELLAGDAMHGLGVRRLDVERAFHSATMDPAAEVVRAAMAAVPSQRPEGRLLSNSTGDYADPDAVRTPAYWAQHLRQPVLLDASMTTLLGSGCDTFVELGPGTSMIAALRRSSDWDSGHTTVPMLGRAGEEERALLRALGTFWERGTDLALDAVDAGRTVCCSLPGHPFAARDPENGSARSESPKRRPPASATRPTEPDSLRHVLERLWCTALGVHSAAADDDFFALGGESLTAVDLLSRIHEETRLAISVTEFSRDGTFGGLIRLTEQKRSGGPLPAVRVVALNHGGPGRPLFLAADATGNVLSYQALAGLLDGVRPVHGLEPVDAAAGRLAIEDSAAHHVAAIRRIQPSGPYTIGGWSFGAVLAHEMAHQLTGHGERVDALICLDAVLPGRIGRPVALDPGFLAGSLWLQASAALGIGPAGRQVRHTPGLRRLLAAKFRVVARYRPRAADCPAVVLKAGLSQRAMARLPRRLSTLYGGGVQVLPAAGDHWTMLAPPHVQGLVRSLHEALSDEETA
jgi:phthiocerol/phenolphthiocerol synthesis type-I polyketide synthase E